MADVPSSSDFSTKWLGVTTQENWEKCLKYEIWGASDKRSKGLKQIRVGDKVVVYIKPMKIAGIFEVSREYFYDDSKIWTNGLFPHRIEFVLLEKILSEPIDIKRMYDKFLKPKKGSARGYFGMGIRKLPETEYKMFESFINENLSIKPHVFVTGYSNANIQHSVRWSILGWRDNPHNLKAGDIVFIYDIDNQSIDTGFRILNKSINYNPVWQEEI